MRNRRKRIGIVLVPGAVALALAGPAASAERFPLAQTLDAKLVRGKSTKAEVLLLLGEPHGSGGTRLPTDRAVRDIWYYEDNRVSGTFSLTMDQKVFLVFFRGDRYDGYLWFRNRAEGGMR
jgi:hypothetical protein